MAVCMLFLCYRTPHVVADTTYTVTVTVQGLPPNLVTNLYVNGINNGTLAGGASQSYTLYTSNSPYSISVDTYVQGSDNGTRYFCTSPTWTVSSSTTNVFTYVPQYFLTVRSAYGTASGQGWYTSGTQAQATINDQEVLESQGTRYVFSGWSRDAAGAQLQSSSIVMNAPKVAVADWGTQFYLTVQSNAGNVTGLKGSGWYDDAVMANVSAPTIIAMDSGTRLEFDHWSGELSGQQPVGVVSMDRPKTIQANYVDQYYLSVQYVPAEVANSYNETHAGWYSTNSDVQLGPVPTTITISPVERLQFTGWSDSGSLSNNLSYAVAMDKPRNVTLSYSTEYYLNVQSAYGTMSGSGWYNRGAVATVTGPTSYGTWPITYSLTGWIVNPPSVGIVGDGGSWTIIVDGPYVVQAQWSMNYLPLIMLFAVVGSVSTIGTATFVGYKRGSFTHKKPGKLPTAPTIASVCKNCGSALSTGAQICDKCSAAPVFTHLPSTENKVYDYIVNHNGIISLSAASADLGVPLDELTAITERLKREGRLS